MLLSLSLSVHFHTCIRTSHPSAKGLANRASGAHQLSAAVLYSLSGLTRGATA